MKRIRYILAAALATLLALAGTLMVAAPANALFETSKQQACQGANLNDTGGCDTSNASENQISNTIKTVLNILSLVVGIIAVIMLIIGGIRFVTSQGEGSSTALARNTVIYALVGIVIVVISQVLVQFVISKTANSGVTTRRNDNGSVTTTKTNPDGSTSSSTSNPDGSVTNCTNGVCKTVR